MWTPKWYDVLFMVFTSPATWIALVIVAALLAWLMLRAAWRLSCRLVRKGGE